MFGVIRKKSGKRTWKKSGGGGDPYNLKNIQWPSKRRLGEVIVKYIP